MNKGEPEISSLCPGSSESILAPSTLNPLIEILGPYRSEAQLSEVLRNDPLEGVDLKNLDEFKQHYFSDMIEFRFEPLGASLQLARQIQRLIFVGYEHRNPIKIENRKRANTLLSLQRLKDAPRNPGAVASGCIVQGITGVSKTKSIENYFRLLPQCYVHHRSVALGMERYVQVVFLCVAMKSTLAGLCFSFFAAFDEATKESEFPTSYLSQYSTRSLTVDKLQLKVGQLLVQHNVGVVVLDEIQPRNFSQTSNLNLFLLFLLQLLNFGVPIVFVGNPLGFEGVDDFSQDWRRLTKSEPIYFHPLEEASDDWFRFAAMMWFHDVLGCHEPILSRPKGGGKLEMDQAISQEYFLCGGGIPGLQDRPITWLANRLSRVPRETRPRAGAKLLEEFRRSDQYTACEDLIEGFAQKDVRRLMRFSDIPWELYGQRWGTLSDADIVELAPSSYEHGSRGDSSNKNSEEQADLKAYGAAHRAIKRKAERRLAAAKRKTARNVPKFAKAKDVAIGGLQTMADLKKRIEHEKSERRK